MSVGHYENFPVASLLLPAPLREPVAVIYRFARSADDFADEGDDPPEARLAKLDALPRRSSIASKRDAADDAAVPRTSRASSASTPCRLRCSATCSTPSRRTW